MIKQQMHDLTARQQCRLFIMHSWSRDYVTDLWTENSGGGPTNYQPRWTENILRVEVSNAMNTFSTRRTQTFNVTKNCHCATSDLGGLQ